MSNKTKQADPEVLNLMESQGGSFVANLAKAWKHADLGNNSLLMQAFGNGVYATYEGQLKQNLRQEYEGLRAQVVAEAQANYYARCVVAREQSVASKSVTQSVVDHSDRRLEKLFKCLEAHEERMRDLGLATPYHATSSFRKQWDGGN